MISKIRTAIEKPSTLVDYVERRTITRIGRKYLYSRHGAPVNPFTEDWDNLLVLDACRYDTFAKLNSLPGELNSRYSPGSGTMEWLRKTVAGREFHDTVYVTANPRVSRYRDRFHKVVPAWESHWNEELKVTPPGDVADLTREAVRDYPDKRVVAHFMQPHMPFIGTFGQSVVGIHDGTSKGRNRALDRDYTANEGPYVLLKRGEVDSTTVRKAYRENLQLVLGTAGPLLGDLDGRTVVTSDHGEMFGELGWPVPRRRYGHPVHTAARALLHVPWLVHQSGERRETTTEPPRDEEDVVTEDAVRDRLEHLGYR